jgi:hypothetical protein
VPGQSTGRIDRPFRLEAFDQVSRSAATTEAEQFNTNFFGALQSADRSWWTSTYDEWGYPLGLGRHAAIKTRSAARDLYASVVAHAWLQESGPLTRRRDGSPRIFGGSQPLLLHRPRWSSVGFTTRARFLKSASLVSRSCRTNQKVLGLL